MFCYVVLLISYHLPSFAPAVRTLRVITGCGTHGMGKSKLKQSVGLYHRRSPPFRLLLCGLNAFRLIMFVQIGACR